jgi:maleylacetate reductase
MKTFTYNANPARVIFGTGTFKQLPSEIARLSIKRPLVLSTPEQKFHADAVEELIKSSSSEHPEIKSAGQFNNATMHTPMEVTLRALEFVKQTSTDGLIAIGGGSTTGLAKALALQTDLPQIIIPTTYAGSEMTPIIGQTENGQKTTQSTPKVLPEVVIYDVNFTMSLPVGLSAYSGMNAIAHSVEALYSQSANPVVDLMAIEGIQALSRALPLIMESEGKDKDARSDALYGAWLCASCLGLVGMSLHHKLCHVLGGTFNLPHAETHTIVLPHALSYNLPQLPQEVKKKLSRAFSATGTEEGDPIEGLNELMRKLSGGGVKRALKDVGMPEEGIDKAAEAAVKNPYWNPRGLEQTGIREVIRRAWAGEDARADI